MAQLHTDKNHRTVREETAQASVSHFTVSTFLDFYKGLEKSQTALVINLGAQINWRCFRKAKMVFRFKNL